MIDNMNTFFLAYLSRVWSSSTPHFQIRFNSRGNVEESKHTNGDRSPKTNKEWTPKNTSRTLLVRVAVREISMVSATIVNMALGLERLDVSLCTAA